MATIAPARSSRMASSRTDGPSSTVRVIGAADPASRSARPWRARGALDARHARQACEIELDGAAPARQPARELSPDRIALVATDLEEGDAALGQRARQEVDEPSDDGETVRTPVEGLAWLEARRPGQARDRVAADVRQVRDDDVPRSGSGRKDVRDREVDPDSDGVSDRVLARQGDRVARHVGGEEPHLVEHAAPPERDGEGHDDGPGTRADVHDLDRR